MKIKLSNGNSIPMEMHKVKIVQQTTLPPVEARRQAINAAGYNTFLLRTRDIFLDMLTDSGTNAMSDNQLAAMMQADDAYAGCESFYRLQSAVEDVLGFKYLLPAHQGRAAEHLLAKAFVKPGDVVIMNYHFTTSKAHVDLAGGKVLELYKPGAMQTVSDDPFKGNMDLDKLEEAIRTYGTEKISYVRMEATTNLIGGQPFSLENLLAVKKITTKHGVPLVFDGSLISENAFFIHEREHPEMTISEIIHEMMSVVDIFYMSARKSAAARGGLIATNQKSFFDQILPWVPVYEGFSTYGGMSSREIEAIAVGLREMTDLNVAGSGAEFVEFFVRRLLEEGLPVVTPAGGLACHLDALRFLPHVPQLDFTSGALSAAIYLVSGVRGMERGTVSTDRDEKGNNVAAGVELVRMAVPRRLYTMSHIEYTVDRLKWLYEHRELVKGLRFVEEPPVLRFFFGKMEAIDDWDLALMEAFVADFGSAC